VVEVGEWSVVVGVTGVVSPFWLVFDSLLGLDIEAIITSDVVWTSLAVIEMVGWTIVIRAAGVVAPLRLVLLALWLFVNVMVMVMVTPVKLDSLRRSQENGHDNCILHVIIK